MTSALHLSRTKISALESEIRDLRLWSEEQSHLFEAELEALKKESSNYKKESHGLRQDISVLQKQLEEKEAARSALQNKFGSLQRYFSVTETTRGKGSSTVSLTKSIRLFAAVLLILTIGFGGKYAGID